MKKISCVDYQMKKIEGSWNEKTYKSYVNDSLYRIYVNDKAVNITEEELQKIIDNVDEEKLRIAMNELEKIIKYADLATKYAILRRLFDDVEIRSYIRIQTSLYSKNADLKDSNKSVEKLEDILEFRYDKIPLDIYRSNIIEYIKKECKSTSESYLLTRSLTELVERYNIKDEEFDKKLCRVDLNR